MLACISASSLPSGFEPIEASGAEPAWRISAQFRSAQRIQAGLPGPEGRCADPGHAVVRLKAGDEVRPQRPVAVQPQRQNDHEVLIEKIDPSRRVVAPRPGNPPLVTDGRRIGQRGADPVHALSPHPRERVLGAVAAGAFVERVVKLILPEEDANTVMRLDHSTAVGANKMLPIGGLVGQLEKRRQRHYQPPPRRILKTLNFSSVLDVGPICLRLSRSSSLRTTASLAVPAPRVSLMRLEAAPSSTSHS